MRLKEEVKAIEEMWEDELYIHTLCLSAVDELFTNISRSLEFTVPFLYVISPLSVSELVSE
jgi:hypothetical protein